MTDYHLKELGFTEGEERVYIALLKLGSASTGIIAKESTVSRSKLYEILEKLTKKGVVSHFKKNNVSYFTASPPSRIANYLKEKEELLEKQRKLFSDKISIFEKLVNNKELAKEAQVFEGMEGIKNMREVALKDMSAGSNIYFFGNPASGHDYVLGYWDDWNKRRIAKKINAYIIYNQDAKEFGERRAKQNYTKVKYLPNKGKTPAWIEIYGSTLAIVLKYKTPMSIVINNELIAESFRTYFNILWAVSSAKI